MVGIIHLKGRVHLETGLSNKLKEAERKRQIQMAGSEINKQAIYKGKNPFPRELSESSLDC